MAPNASTSSKKTSGSGANTVYPSAVGMSAFGAESVMLKVRSSTTSRPDISVTGASSGVIASSPLASLAGNLVGALDADQAEEVAVQRCVRAVCAPVPRVDEALRRDRSPVVEGPAVLQRDHPVDVVLGLDRLGDLELRRRGVRVVAHQLREDRVERVATAGLVRVRRHQRVLGLTAADDDGAGGAFGTGAFTFAGAFLVVTAATGAQYEREADGADDRPLASEYSHGCPPRVRICPGQWARARRRFGVPRLAPVRPCFNDPNGWSDRHS